MHTQRIFGREFHPRILESSLDLKPNCRDRATGTLLEIFKGRQSYVSLVSQFGLSPAEPRASRATLLGTHLNRHRGTDNRYTRPTPKEG